MWKDPIVEETRKLRDQYAARFGYDVAAIYRDLKEQEKKSGRKVLLPPPRKLLPAGEQRRPRPTFRRVP